MVEPSDFSAKARKNLNIAEQNFIDDKKGH